MKIHRRYSDFKTVTTVTTIGMFDGVHRGHRGLIDRVKQLKSEINGESLAITFEPHPRLVLSKDASLSFLTSLEEKVALLEKAGLDHLLIIPFTVEFSRMSACDFVKNILLEGIGTRNLVVGFDHQFGHRGHTENISVSDCAARHGIRMERVGPFMDGNIPLSSSAIRNFILQGDLERANSLLGYDYFLKGSVIEGLKIGRSMGYPTANLKPGYDFKLIPAAGVYAVEVEVDNVSYDSMLYIGTRPTLEESDGKLSIEAHLLDYNGDLYGKSVTVHFRHRIRGDIKFAGKDELKKQIDKDREDTIALLGG